jgi:hypothetical protein
LVIEKLILCDIDFGLSTMVEFYMASIRFAAVKRTKVETISLQILRFFNFANGCANNATLATNLAAVPDDLSDAFITAHLQLQAQRDQTTQYVYNKDGRLRYVLDALKYVTENVYDAGGNVIRTIAYASPITLPGNLNVDSIANALVSQLQQTHVGDRITRMVYDAANLLAATSDALGFVTYNRYDVGGGLVERTQYLTRTFQARRFPVMLT